ncbi:hypothetical protein C1H46_000661 [Malus baccata]|uniref:Uncharacterized protein n=1 Tax=Malus baccata TaxID=106549 RepID=A0A540NRJ2_MALBA|nr:hypothetical protein C1H46_000661 [Malus baccata]
MGSLKSPPPVLRRPYCHAPIPTYVQDRHATSPNTRISNTPYLLDMNKAPLNVQIV